MDNAVAELCEAIFVFGIVQRLGIASVGKRRFGQYEFVHDLVERIKPDFEEVEFIEETEAVVDHLSYRCFLSDVQQRAKRQATALAALIPVIQQSMVLSE